MVAGAYNFTLEQGATFAYTLLVKTPTGAAVELTGWSARMQIRKKHTSTTVVASPACAVSPATGAVSLLLAASATALLTPGEYVYDVELYTSEATPKVIRIVEGSLTVTPEVTR